jgi:hypothetical protein
VTTFLLLWLVLGVLSWCLHACAFVGSREWQLSTPRDRTIDLVITFLFLAALGAYSVFLVFHAHRVPK